LGPIENDVKYYSWETFLQPTHKEPCSAYISDAGTAAFDAAIETRVRKTHVNVVNRTIIQPKTLLNSLLALGLGLESLLFTWDKPAKAFKEVIKNARGSGFSLRATQAVVQRFIRIGNITRHLRSSAEKIYATQSALPARVALASAVLAILNTIESHLLPKVASVQSLLQVQQLFQRPQHILDRIQDIIADTRIIKNDQQLASTLFQQLQRHDQEDNLLRLVMLHIVARVSRPSLELLAAWTGLSSHFVDYNWASLKDGFVEVLPKPSDLEGKAMDEYSYRPEGMPSFVSVDDGYSIFEIGKSIRLLRHHHPQHPLSDPARFGINPPVLEWRFEWRDMEVIASETHAYENAVTSAILSASQPPHISTTVVTGVDVPLLASVSASDKICDLSQGLLDIAERLDSPPQDLLDMPDALRQVILSHLENSNTVLASHDSIVFAPPLALTPLLSLQPIFSAQARLVNAATIRVLFRAHGLRMHLRLQRNYHLFGDGVFMSRLSSSLFDPDLSSAERQRGSLRLGTSMGLRLTGRKSWPPASSELRLALMGVLSETYTSSSLFKNSKPSHDELRDKRTVNLPGDLSFAIRQLSPEEIEKCMDPNSLYALDFLRLQYTPPSPVHTIITTSAMDKYDSIFKFLLRLARMLFVISYLPRNSAKETRLRMEAHHFVSCCASYFFDGVRETWASFERYLDEVEAAIASEDAAGAFGRHVSEGIESLRTKHERVLDQISFKLLLRGRQRQIMALLEGIFEIVLAYASNTGNSTELHNTFREKTHVFLTVCRGLVGKKGYGKTKHGGDEDENTVDRLVLALEMSGYYATEPREDD